jgi:hypothetical protein
MSGPLPTSAEAMYQAVERAQLGDVEGGTLWLGIARELRAGEAARPRPRPLDHADEVPSPRPIRTTHLGDDSLLPICEEVGTKDPQGALVAFNLPDVNCFACLSRAKETEVAEAPIVRHVQHEDALGDYAGEQAPSARVQRLAVPADPPMYRNAETEILRIDHSEAETMPRCGQPSCGHSVELDLNQVPAIWIHSITGQSVCPVSDPAQTHTFAQPAMDARG